jgi:adenylate cyclase
MLRHFAGNEGAIARFLDERPSGSVYQLATGIRVDRATVHLWWHLTNLHSGEICWTANDALPLTPSSDALVETSIAEEIAIAIAERNGLVKSFQALAIPDAPSPGYTCVLLAQRYTLAIKPELHAKICDGLEKTVELYPKYADAWAYLAIMYSEASRNGFNRSRSNHETMMEARAALANAIQLAPHTATTYYATAIVSHQLGDMISFETAARRVIQLSPSDPKVLTIMGNRFWVNGHFEEGIGFVRRALALTKNPGPLDGSILACEAYRTGKYDEVISPLREATDPYTVSLLIAASYGKLGNVEAARPYVDRLLTLRPDYAREMREDFANRHVIKGFTESIAEGLRMAGVPIGD